MPIAQIARVDATRFTLTLFDPDDNNIEYRRITFRGTSHLGAPTVLRDVIAEYPGNPFDPVTIDNVMAMVDDFVADNNNVGANPDRGMSWDELLTTTTTNDESEARNDDDK